MVREFQAQVTKNRAAATLFKRDPNRALAAFGFAEDFRREILRDSDRLAEESCWFTCIRTCWCTGCCCTGNTIVISL
jgi:hypothetical protein